MIKKQFVYFFLELIIVTSTLSQDNIGDVCFIRNTRVQGICKLSKDCQSAKESARKGISPTLCILPELSDTILVCCEESGVPKPHENSFLHTTTANPGSVVFPDSIDAVLPKAGSKSESKCAEYSKLVTKVAAARPLVIDVRSTSSIEVPKCEYTSIQLIVGGKPASPGEFPFMAAIGYNSEDGVNGMGWLCGGTLISEYYVMTAAHCALTKLIGPPIKVRLGELDFTKEDDGSKYVDYGIAEIKVHEKYRSPLLYHDIALLKLSAEVKFSAYIRPACIWTKNTIDTDKTIATGWGKTEHGTTIQYFAVEGILYYTGIASALICKAEDPSDKLLKVTLNIYDNQRCSKHFPPDPRKLSNGIQPTMICAGGQRGNDTCQGDSGGPLVVIKKNPCLFHVIGITSFGRTCGGAIPAIYTRVSEYVAWIENIVW